MRVLFIGDIIGNPGRKVIKEFLPDYRKMKKIDFCVANGENAVGGTGLTYSVAQELIKSGIDVITLGNHTWAKKEILGFIGTEKNIIRPANYPRGNPGKGSVVAEACGTAVGVLNIMGRVYMDPIDCPFAAADREIEYLSSFTDIIITDFHAEATSEKNAMGYYLDGRVTAVIGTHTHVQTVDEKILPSGTAYITDAGMTGPFESVIGVDKEIALNRFLTQIPHKFEIATKGEVQFNAVIIDVDERTHKAAKIERVFERYSL